MSSELSDERVAKWVAEAEDCRPMFGWQQILALAADRDRLARALARVEALADEYAADEAEHLARFGHHHPVAWNAERHLRDALRGDS